MEYNQKKQLTPAEEAAQKAYKASKESFRASIKTFVDAQLGIKPLLKPGATHELAPWQAQSKKHNNSVNLRNLHIAFAIFRGKPIPEFYWEWNGKEIVRNSQPALKMGRNDKLVEPTKPSDVLIKVYLQQHVTQAIYPNA